MEQSAMAAKDIPLVVTCISASDCIARDAAGVLSSASSDPFVECSVLGAEDPNPLTTSKKDKTLSPVWKEALQYVLKAKRETWTLVLNLLDWNKYSDPDFMGHVELTLVPSDEDGVNLIPRKEGKAEIWEDGRWVAMPSEPVSIVHPGLLLRLELTARSGNSDDYAVAAANKGKLGSIVLRLYAPLPAGTRVMATASHAVRADGSVLDYEEEQPGKVVSFRDVCEVPGKEPVPLYHIKFDGATGRNDLQVRGDRIKVVNELASSLLGSPTSFSTEQPFVKIFNSIATTKEWNRNDRVRIISDKAQAVRNQSQSDSNWLHPDMDLTVGCTGVVVEVVPSRNLIKVQFGGTSGRTYTYTAENCERVLTAAEEGISWYDLKQTPVGRRDPTRILEFMAEADLNKDGRIDLAEWMAFVNRCCVNEVGTALSSLPEDAVGALADRLRRQFVW